MKSTCHEQIASLEHLLNNARYEELAHAATKTLLALDRSVVAVEEYLRILYLQHEGFYRHGDFSSSFRTANEIKEALQESEGIPSALRCSVLLAIGRSVKEQLDFTTAEHYIQQAISCVTAEEHPSLYGSCLFNTGLILLNKNLSKEAEQCYRDALALFLQDCNSKAAGTAQMHLGLLLSNRERYDEALQSYRQSEASYISANYKHGLASLYNNTGNLFAVLTDFTSALEYYEKCLLLSVELQKDSTLCSAYINTGNIYFQLGDIDTAQQRYRQALELSIKIGAQESTIHCYNNLGATYGKRGDFDQCLELFEKALQLYQQKNDKHGEVNGYGQLAQVYMDKGQYDKAVPLLHQCEAFYAAEGLELKRSTILFRLAQIHNSLAKDDEDRRGVLALLQEAHGIVVPIGARIETMEISQAISETYASLGDWEQALRYHRQYHDASVHVNATSAKRQTEIFEKNRRIAEIEKERQIQEAAAQQQKDLLYNMLPRDIAERILLGEQRIAEEKPSASIFFSDIVGFTQLASILSAKDLVANLDDLFSIYDQIAASHGVEKIKTIGDSYMAVCGVPEFVIDHAYRMERFAQEVLSATQQFAFNGHPVRIRIGIHVGSVIAGVIGLHRHSYDLWGDSVNLASRLETTGQPNRIHVSEDFVAAYNTQRGTLPNVVPVGMTELKNRGPVMTYLYV